MTSRGSAANTAGRRARSWALLLSVGFHLVLLGWFALKRGIGEPSAEPPTIAVQLIRPPRLPTPAPATAPPSPTTGRALRVQTDVAPRFVPAPPAASGNGKSGRGGVDLYGPVFADGQWPRPDRGLKSLCDPQKDPARLSPACRQEDEIARAVTAANDPWNGKGEFANEARRNEKTRSYRETIGGEYPGIACAILHRC